jgi:hypothetical protein
MFSLYIVNVYLKLETHYLSVRSFIVHVAGMQIGGSGQNRTIRSTWSLYVCGDLLPNEFVCNRNAVGTAGG